MDEIKLEEVRVMYMQSVTGPADAHETFVKLELHISKMAGRKLYGTFKRPEGIYRACVTMQEGDDAKALDLEAGVIPGGTYARRTLVNWQERRAEIGETFILMSAEAAERYDTSRPSIEFYRSEAELDLFLPIR